MKTIKILIFISLLGTSCSSMFHVIDGYCVSNEYDNNQLFCNPGCDNLFIEYVKSIRWNSKNIIVEQLLSNNKQNWYLIVAKDDSLKCLCNDSLLGPFTVNEMDSVLTLRDIDTLKMKKKIWRTSE